METVAWFITGGTFNSSSGPEIDDYDIELETKQCEQLNIAGDGKGERIPLVPKPEWQPIETAPNTGDVLLAWRGKYSDEWTIEVNETTKWDGFRRRPHLYATHWMPLPEPPHGA